MAQKTLVGVDVDLGHTVLRRLDDAGFPVVVAIWLLTEEFGGYRLFLASPLYERPGIDEAYHRLVAAVPADLLLSVHVHLEGTQNKFVRALRKIFGKAKSVEGMRLGGQSIGDVWVEDAYVYRIR